MGMGPPPPAKPAPADWGGMGMGPPPPAKPAPADCGGMGIGPPPPAKPAPKELDASTTINTITRIAIFIICFLQFCLFRIAQELPLEYRRNQNPPQQLQTPLLLVITRGSSGSSRERSEEHTSELQSHRDLHSFPTRRSSDLARIATRVQEKSESATTIADTAPSCNHTRFIWKFAG